MPIHPLAPPAPAPVPFAEVTRGQHVESVHVGSAAVVLEDGRMWTAGDARGGVWMRSAIKPFQALPLVESGAAVELGLGDAELALLCASHDGTPAHVEVARRLLARGGLDEECLRCGPHAPFDQRASLDIARAGGKPQRIHNNCSGKHSGFLLLAQRMGVPLESYLDPDSASQLAIRAAVADCAGISPDAIETALDGCGAPTLRLSLVELAQAYLSWMNPDALGAVRAAACRRLFRAVHAEPEMVAGRDRLCTALVRSAPGRVQGKNGAEGVYAFGGRGPSGAFGVAVKVADGAERGYFPAVIALAQRLGLWAEVPKAEVPVELHRFAEPVVFNTQKLPVGEVRCTLELPDFGALGQVGGIEVAR